MALEKEWWRKSVVYQIYPQSFQDSNGDGVGDLNGIRRRLPYLAQLGIDVIWICPIFLSPMVDLSFEVVCDMRTLCDELIAGVHEDKIGPDGAFFATHGSASLAGRIV